MNLHTKVIKHLEQTKNYVFINADLAYLYDIVYATKEILEKQPLQTSEPLPESKL